MSKGTGRRASAWKRLQRRLRAGPRAVPAPVGCTTVAAYLARHPGAAARKPGEAVELTRVLPSPDDLPMRWRFEPWARETLPSAWVLDVPGARVFEEGVVITPDNEILRDVSLDYRAAADEHRLCERVVLPRPRRVAGRLAVLAVAEGNTYFHWLFDVVPRLQILGELPYDRVLVECDRRFQQEWLAMAEIAPDQVVPARRHGHFAPDVLVVPSLPDVSLHVTPTNCAWLRDVAARAGALSPREPRRRLYVSRADAGRRRLTNEDEVWQVLAARGFERLEPGGLGAREQIRVFSEASVVVGPHGAGFSNLVFCAPGTRVLEMFAPSYLNPCFWGVADAVALRYEYLLGEGPLPPRGTEPTSVGENFRVDPRALDRALDTLDL